MSSGESDSEIPSMSRAASSAKHERGSPAMASAFPGHGFPFHHDQSPSGSMLSSSMPGLYSMMHPQNQGLHSSASFNGGHRMGAATGRQRGRPRGVGTGGARGSGKVRGRNGANTTTSSVSSSITTPGTNAGPVATSQTIPSSSSQVPVSNPSTSSPTDQPISTSGSTDLVILPVQTSTQLTSMSPTIVSQTSNPMLSQSSFSAQQPSSNCQPKPLVMGPPATTSQPFIQDSDDILLGEDLRNDDVDRCLYERIPEGLPADIFSDNSTEEGMGGLGSSVSSEA